MPILNLKSLSQMDPAKIKPALVKCAEKIAETYGCDPKHVWVTWQAIEPGMYVEGNLGAEIQPEDSHPPLGELICLEGKDEKTIRATLLAASEILGKELNLGENVFIIYREVKKGTVVSGKTIVE